MSKWWNDVPSDVLMPKKRFTIRIPWGLIVMFAFVAINIMIVSVAIVQFLYVPKIRADVNSLRKTPVAIVLGASVKTDGTPSDALSDRILSAVDLYKKGIVNTILMTGDDGLFHIDEISVMRQTAIDAGVPEKDIWTDGHGYRTYESCNRAIKTFHISQAIIVTQRFHLSRALFLCNELGMDATGFIADRHPYKDIRRFWIRDLASSVKAFWDVVVHEPEPPVQYEEE